MYFRFRSSAILIAVLLFYTCKNAPVSPADKVIDTYETVVEKWEKKNDENVLVLTNKLEIERDEKTIERDLEQYYPLNEGQKKRTIALTNRLKTVIHNLPTGNRIEPLTGWLRI